MLKLIHRVCSGRNGTPPVMSKMLAPRKETMNPNRAEPLGPRRHLGRAEAALAVHLLRLQDPLGAERVPHGPPTSGTGPEAGASVGLLTRPPLA